MNPFFLAVVLWLGTTIAVIVLFYFFMRTKHGRE